LQAVCDAELRFLDCFAGFAGSVGDRRVFRNSDLWKKVNTNRAAFLWIRIISLEIKLMHVCHG